MRATSEEIKKVNEAHGATLVTKDAEITSLLARIKELEGELSVEKAKATEAREQAADIAYDSRERGFYLAKDQAQHLFPNLDFSAMGVMKEITAEGLCPKHFRNEVEILTGLVHPNLVSLNECTARNSPELLLVYEYISNGTVAKHLRGRRANPALSCPSRMCIAVETASALKYFHAAEVIHRDVKTDNILLDMHFHIKLADFILSRLLRHDVSHVTTGLLGTPGYVDTEYSQCYRLTSKSNVYNFGVVLIERISSLPTFEWHTTENLLANIAITKIQNQKLHELVHPSLGFDSDSKVNQMISGVVELAFRCLQSSGSLRPSMDEVLSTL
ncbi:LEAF RUST 10 DISEASE-RESISTANCE LOCUS RECEPTOR-LIKE PROTEIN KINASE-like 1.2 [Lotus japonicus]|uniref:LEAF RUST 10 DISEASE-RESISTANCE LOCUS RECEPTOR-LIKE PROTEIN KINASE-like 1.2 n=1 Tax=Lotus japonicus TaxID=34305 RepID=UPI00258EA288|nr:LEAF RUST 10 DISEASE-RESISTANCE LOCUS RECEPTOR-LIKE PROTEIN KINASE-like 1.2 [Lotus japonicus]